jgi:hypothetical protein
MYRPRRVGRGATSFPSDAWSPLSVCAWCAGYSASDDSRSARTTVHRWTTWHHVWCATASIKEHDTNPLRRHPSPRWWRLRPNKILNASCAIRRPCYPQIRIDTSESYPASSTAWSDPRRVRLASGLRDPPRHVVVAALDLLQQVGEIGTALRRTMSSLLRGLVGPVNTPIPRRSVVHSRADTSCTSMQPRADNHSPIKHAHVSSLWAG